MEDQHNNFFFDTLHMIENRPLTTESISRMQSFLVHELEDRTKFLDYAITNDKDEFVINQKKWELQRVERALSLRNNIDQDILDYFRKWQEEKRKEN